MLVVVDVPPGQAPEAVARLDRPATAHDMPLVGLDHDQGHYLGVAPEHVPAPGATFHVAALERSWLKGGAAVHAVVPHRTDGRHIATRILASSSGDNGERPGTRSFRRLAARRRVDHTAKDNHSGRPDRLRWAFR